MSDGEKRTEACGRCSMSTVVDAVSGDMSDEERTKRDPFGTERIEISESDLRRVSPAGWLSDTKTRLDNLARRLTYGR